MINLDVTKNQAEKNNTLLRRFTKRVQESGIIKRVRGIRYKDRNKSPYVNKKKTLASLERRGKIEEMLKLGRNPELLKR